MALGDIVNSFPHPTGTYAQGLAWDGKYLWCLESATNVIYQLNPADGSVIRTILGPSTALNGLTFDGKHLWVGNVLGLDTILEIDPYTGAIVRNFPFLGISGLAFDGEKLWASSAFIISCVDRVTGAVVQTYPYAPDVRNCDGLTFDGKSLWSVHFHSHVYQFNPNTGNVAVDFFGPEVRARGLTFDGKYLWYASGTTIYQLSLS